MSMLDSMEYKEYASSATVVTDDLIRYGEFVVTTTPCQLTIVDCDADNYRLRGRFRNDGTGVASLVNNTGFGRTGQTVIPILPGQTVELVGTRAASSTYKWAVLGEQDIDQLESWTPTLTFTAAGDPGTLTTAFRYAVIGGWWVGFGRVSSTDGSGKTGLTITCPFQNAANAMKLAGVGTKSIDGVVTNCYPYVNGAANGLIQFEAFGTWTDDTVCSLEFMVAAPLGVGGLEDWGAQGTTADGASTFGTADPASVAEEGRYALFSKASAAIMAYYASSADSNAVSSAVVTLPSPMVDLNLNIPMAGYEIAGAGGVTLVDCLPFFDGTTNLQVEVHNFTTGTDGQAWALAALGAYPTGVRLYTMTYTAGTTGNLAFGTAAPGTMTIVARFVVIGRVVILWITATSADGNAASSCEIALPVACAYVSGLKVPVAAHQKVNTTWTNAMGYIDAGQALAANRTIEFSNWQACTDAAAMELDVMAIYPV